MIVTTKTERLISDWLNKNGVDYLFKTNLAGGYYSLGSAICDFILPNWIILRVNEGYGQETINQVQEAMLEEEGWTIVDVWIDDVRDKLDEVMEKAITGEELQ